MFLSLPVQLSPLPSPFLSLKFLPVSSSSSSFPSSCRNPVLRTSKKSVSFLQKAKDLHFFSSFPRIFIFSLPLNLSPTLHSIPSPYFFFSPSLSHIAFLFTFLSSFILVTLHDGFIIYFICLFSLFFFYQLLELLERRHFLATVDVHLANEFPGERGQASFSCSPSSSSYSYLFVTQEGMKNWYNTIWFSFI